jgi:hypothetical protein
MDKRRLRGVALALPCLAILSAPMVAEGETPDLSIPVRAPDGTLLGTIDLYIGTYNFVPGGSQGLGQPSDGGPKSGFAPANGGSLDDAAAASGETGFNWLQIVTEQPPAQDGPFGPTPHVDKFVSSPPHPHDGDPGYFDAVDLPPGTATLLPFVDFPFDATGGTFSFVTYLVSLLPDDKYDLLAGFEWSDVSTGAGAPFKVTGLQQTSTLGVYDKLVYDYGTAHWENIASYQPEPSTWVTMILGLGLAGLQLRRRRPRAAA